MLEYRHEESNLATTRAIQVNEDQIKRLAEQAATGNELMLTLTEGMRADSRTVKVFTLLALLYAPASLAAVSLFIYLGTDTDLL